MEVEFRSTQLEECFRYAAKAVRAWGKEVARRYVERIVILQGARSVAELHDVPPLRFHALKGDRQGQYSLTLVGRWRLIITVRDEAMTVVRVEEVSKHYGN